MDDEERLRRIESLSSQQRKILELMCAGLQDRDILHELHIGSSTLYKHKALLYEKLGISEKSKAERQREVGRYRDLLAKVPTVADESADLEEREETLPIPSERALIAAREDAGGLVVAPTPTIIVQPASGQDPRPEGPGPDDPGPGPRIRAWLLLVLASLIAGMAGAALILVIVQPNRPREVVTERIVVATVALPTVIPQTQLIVPAASQALEPGATVGSPTMVTVASATRTARPVDPNTPPGTILTVGESWYQDGLRLMLDNAYLENNRFLCETALGFRVRVVNETGTELIANTSTDDWYSVDNTGRRRGITTRGGGSGGCLSWPVSLLRPGTFDFPTAYVSISLQEIAPLSWVRVTIPRLARADNATWEIPVPR